MTVGCDPPAPAPERPNIVLIIGDDHGYRDFGFMGSERISTPNLDRLAESGTVLSRGFVTASTCGPSLRSLVTGLHPIQLRRRQEVLRARGVMHDTRSELIEFVTLPRVLAEAGYRSFQAGKFFGGSYDVAGFSDGMSAPGSDLSFGGSGKWFGRRTGLEPVEEFLDDVGAAPFFLWFAPMLPHRPFDAPARYDAPYEDQELSRSALGYYANITRFDDLVGELLANLEARGLRDDTLIVYLSDNGWDQAPEPHFTSSSWDSDGARGKRSMYELGFRTPIVLQWRGVVAAGARHDDLVSSVDLFPTLLGFAGVSSPVPRPGRDLRPLILGTGEWSRDAVVATMRNVRPPQDVPSAEPNSSEVPAAMIRTADWSYIDYEGANHQALYDARADADQNRNVLDAHREVAQQLRSRIREWKHEMTDGYAASLERPAVAPPSR